MGVRVPRGLLALSPLACASIGCLERPDVLAWEEVPVELELSGDLEIHDPSITRVSGGRYRVFGTGAGIAQRSSPDLREFEREEPVFADNPSWIEARVPGVTSLWSPDVSFFEGRYHLYYAASTFGDDRSCIGHATSSDPTTNVWTDRGEIICSNADGVVNDWNAIDPNVLLDKDGTPWLVFGSYLSGIKLTKLDKSGELADGELIAVATRTGDTQAIQASSLFRHGKYYYLFASFDGCCRGVDSTHKIVVGRSEEIDGPYEDRDGEALLDGGGSVLLESNVRFRGPGSNSVLVDGGRPHLVYHAYDTENEGLATLRISTLVFDDGWPVSAGP